MTTVETVKLHARGPVYLSTSEHSAKTQHSDCLQSVSVCFTVYTVYSGNMCASFISKSMFEIFVQQMCFANFDISRILAPRSTKVATFSDQKKGWEGSIDNAGEPSDFAWCHSGDAPGCTDVEMMGILV